VVPKLCSAPGCGQIVRDGSRCAEHRHDRMRPGARNRGYDSTWERRRIVVLRRAPGCEDCGAPATEVDHVPPRRELVRLGVTDPDADRFLHARCKRCHSARTARGG
jgi:5-methylcytosine-specific restriction protein A